ncbi:MAG: RNA methyltransferase [Deltaproteobacteria bacterium]|nr:MAG: RNA methyltransferase [Deltaproteobacteria bacterium]
MDRRRGGATTIEGVRPVIEAIRAGRRKLHHITLPADGGTPGLRELAALVREHGIPTHLGKGEVVAQAEPYPEESFEELLLGQGPRRLVALDRVTDVGNLGSIARTAEAAGVTGLVLEHRRAPPLGPGALRASAGALEFLRVGRTPNLVRALELARSEGLVVLVAEREGGRPLEALDPKLLRGDWVWVFGSEERGVRPRVRAQASEVVAIPLRGQLASLGVAAAAAYLLLRTASFGA